MVNVEELLATEVRKIAAERGLSDEAADVLAWLGSAAMSRGGRIGEAELHSELLRLGEDLLKHQPGTED